MVHPFKNPADEDVIAEEEGHRVGGCQVHLGL